MQIEIVRAEKRERTMEPTTPGGPSWLKRHRAYHKHPRLHIFVSGETLIENIQNRKSRPHQIYRAVLPAIFKQVGLPEDTKASWSQYAGCTCPCSPGFVLKDNYDHFDIYVDIKG